MAVELQDYLPNNPRRSSHDDDAAVEKNGPGCQVQNSSEKEVICALPRFRFARPLARV